MTSDRTQTPFLLRFGERVPVIGTSSDRDGEHTTRESGRGLDGTRKTAVGRETTDED